MATKISGTTGADRVTSDATAYTEDRTWTGAQRGAFVTDNDATLDLNAGNNFFTTITGGTTLTFSDIAAAAGQSGYLKFVNPTSYSVAAAATTKIDASDLARLCIAGTYICSYVCDGTNVYVMVSRAFA